jgi:hypothetical protein
MKNCCSGLKPSTTGAGGRPRRAISKAWSAILAPARSPIDSPRTSLPLWWMPGSMM